MKRALQNFSVHVDQDRKIAQDVVAQVCAIALREQKGTRPCGAREQDVKYSHSFKVKWAQNTYTVVEYGVGDSLLPAALQAAVTQEGRAQHLHISFSPIDGALHVEAPNRRATAGIKRSRP